MKVIGLLLTFFIALRAAPSYSVNDLGNLGSSPALGFKINNSGTVAGWAETIYGYSQAFESASGGTLQALPSISAEDSYALGINSSGVIAGSAYVNGQPHGAIWTGSGATDLGPGMFVTGINDPGVIIGGNGHAFALTNGIYQDLGVLPGGDWSSATGINNSGTVVGDSSGPSGSFRGFRLDFAIRHDAARHLWRPEQPRHRHQWQRQGDRLRQPEQRLRTCLLGSWSSHDRSGNSGRKQLRLRDQR
jgi:hypothetical protein